MNEQRKLKKVELNRRLERCRELAREDLVDSTAEMIREMEAELLQQLRDLEE